MKYHSIALVKERKLDFPYTKAHRIRMKMLVIHSKTQTTKVTHALTETVFMFLICVSLDKLLAA